MMQSGYICECCEDFLHASNEEHSALEDDVECPECGQLCACKCHREKNGPSLNEDDPPIENEED